jgi:hypothetical protein
MISARATLVLCLTCTLSACESVSSDNIQKWKGTQKGPEKLENAFQNPKVDPRLRAEAAAVMLEVDDLYRKVDTGFEALPETDRVQIAKHLIPLYASFIEKGGEDQARTYRDGLFELRDSFTGEQLQQADQILAKALASDLRAGRDENAGRHSVRKIAETLGAGMVGPALLRLIEDAESPFSIATEVIEKLGDQELRHRAGAAMAKRAEKAAELTPAFWTSLAKLGGPEVKVFLETKIRTGSEPDAIAAAEALKLANPGPELLPLALEIASAPGVIAPVQEQMLGVVAAVGGPAAIEGLLRLIGAESSEAVFRYRAFQTALATGQAEALVPALEAFPAQMTHDPEQLTASLVTGTARLGETGRPAALAALNSKSPLARMVAVMALEELGTPEDASVLARLGRDRATLPGFPRNVTVGSQATRVAKALKTGAKKEPALP